MTETTRPSAPTNRYRRTLWQFARFGIVGGSGVAVNMVVAIIMNKLNGGTVNAQQILFGVAGTPYNFRFTSLVWIVGFLVANIWNFQLNRSWTFKSSKHATWFSEFWPFLAVGRAPRWLWPVPQVAFTNPTSPIYLPEPYFHENAGLQSREYWSQLITILLTMPINFVVNKLWTFRAVRGHRLDAKAEQVGADTGPGTED